MSRALLQTVNTGVQDVDANGIINPGSALRRFGCSIRLNGNAILIDAEGYYTINAAVTLAPVAAGEVSAALYLDGVQIPGAVGTGTAAAAGNSVTVPIITTVRMGCACAGANNLTLVLGDAAASVSNVSLRVEKA